MTGSESQARILRDEDSSPVKGIAGGLTVKRGSATILDMERCPLDERNAQHT